MKSKKVLPTMALAVALGAVAPATLAQSDPSQPPPPDQTSPSTTPSDRTTPPPSDRSTTPAPAPSHDGMTSHESSGSAAGWLGLLGLIGLFGLKRRTSEAREPRREMAPGLR
jgi:MYXO-CTERM domain-containing protein